MKLRIKFSKQGPVKFVGHLDVMRYFQKAMRRAGIDIKYSEGFSPHQIMSFAAPLGVGLTSNGEYMDIEVNSMEDCKTMVSQLNEVMAEGIQIMECHILEERAKNAMSLVAAADYTLTFRDGKQPNDLVAFLNGLSDFMGQDHIFITKKTKKGEREIDLKAFIYELSVHGETIFMKISAGSADNIKPELVMEAYYQWLGQTCPEFAFQIQREEVYGNKVDEEHRMLVPLGHIGESLE
ncbi:TIGR03936 family radical SAM-associated protein [Lacrimispora sphenoides]|uniref:Radical SAM-linked protein n=1 Tax=Lacrimispora sphenoides JCM 1415 TaxID=1297793 RepID=A0ABY1C673_9FIRM|nr:TIGR03936 family radical SAM-associated protein [Lacrimispora sphenoides]SET73368.1 radical SAM-linked protein [[Clostridium] sphenoides JCM 1415]SUY50848.1 radical SAM-linked protein [Lacrimispora sphenoides]